MLCLDTYALVQLHDGDPRIVSLSKEDVCITDMTMAEFYGVLLRRFNQKTAEHWLKKLSAYCRPLDRSTLIEATHYRITHMKETFSLTDCIGYVYSQKHNMKFVTGDKAFKKKKGVLFLP